MTRAALLAIGLIAPLIAAESRPIAWVAPALSRIAPLDDPGSAEAIELHAARGETESFQLIVRAPAGGSSQVDVAASDLVGPGGATIGRAQLTLYAEHYVTIAASSPDPGGSNRPLPPGTYPDALIPFVDPATGLRLSGATYTAAPFALAAGRNQPIWIDVAVPRTATPGVYGGTVTATGAGGSATVALRLTVWSFALPVAPALRSCFGYHGANQRVPADAELLLAHRLMPFQVDPSQPGDLPARGLNAIGLPFWSTQDTAACTISPPPSVASLRAAAQRWPPGVQTYEYAADEITPCVPRIDADLTAWSRNVHAAGSNMLVTVMPDPLLYDDGTGSGRSAVDIWVLLPKQIASGGARIAEVLAKGDAVWSYNCLVQDASTPKWEIDFAPANYRIQPGFLDWRSGFSGLLYWGVDHWGDDPWTRPVYAEGGYDYPGEGLLVYPGAAVGLAQAVPSMRLKWLRDGVDDFDYLALLDGLGQRAWAMAQVASIAQDWSRWSQDPLAIEAVRERLGERLDQLVGAPPTIAAQPADQTVTVGQTATFRVVASGAEPLTFRWQRDGVDLAGATGASLVTGATTAADSGAVFRVIVGSAASAATTASAPAMLTVRVVSDGGGSGGTATPGSAATSPHQGHGCGAGGGAAALAAAVFAAAARRRR